MRNDKSILILEDDKVDAITLKRVLKKLKVISPIRICENGEEGLVWLQDNKNQLPGLILLDLNMPRMSGLEFLTIIKKDDVLKTIPVVVLTTSADPYDRKKSFEHSVAGYMLKAVEHEEYISTLKTIRNYWITSQLAY